jgi:ubiquinone/menaquinone biosynthesis C-methylase UbiE
MSERLRRSVDRMSIRPNDRVVEIGCGHGVAATFVCEVLEAGRLTGVDRSRKMIEAATRRNAEHIQRAGAKFICADFENLDLGSRRFEDLRDSRWSRLARAGACTGHR